MYQWPILSLLLLTAPLFAQDDLFPDEPATLTLKPGEKRSFTYIAEVDGEASIWASSRKLDVTLEVLDKSKRVKFDDDSGGGRAAHLFLPVKTDAEFTVVVAAKPVEGEVLAGQITVCLHEAEITKRTKADVLRIEAAIAEMKRLIAEGKHAEARKLDLIEVGPGESSALMGSVFRLASQEREAGNERAASERFSSVLAVFERTLPEDHPALQATRLNLAAILAHLGELQGARRIQEKVLEVRERTLPEDDPRLQSARGHLASTMLILGEPLAARRLLGKVVANLERILPDDHPDLQAFRGNLAASLRALGDLEAARRLAEKVLAVRERTLPEDHADLLLARSNLAAMLSDLGELEAALVLEQQVLSVLERTLPEDHLDLQRARGNLATTLLDLGEIEAAARLQERVLAVLGRVLPPDHPHLQSARINRAASFFASGRLVAARKLQEQVVAVRERLLPEEDLALQSARAKLAATLSALGDVNAARRLFEQVLAIHERTLPEDHLDLQATRLNLAKTLIDSGEFVTARRLFEQAVAVLERILPPDHPVLQTARSNLAATLRDFGELSAARRLFEQVKSVRERTLPEDHPDVQAARGNLAVTLAELGEVTAARRIEEQVVAAFERTLPPGHPDLQRARLNLIATLRSFEESDIVTRLTKDFLSGAEQHVHGRRAASMMADDQASVSNAVSVARTYLADDAPATQRWIALVEEQRATALRRAALSDRIARFETAADATGLELLRVWRQARQSVVARSRDRVAPVGQARDALGERDRTWMAVRDALAKDGEPWRELRFELESVCRGLGAGEMAVGYRRYMRWMPREGEPHLTDDELRDLAYICGPSLPLTVVELGPAATTDRLIDRWRTAPIRDAGEALRAHLVDPVLAAVAAANEVEDGATMPTIRRVFLTPSANVAVLPLEALPMADGRPLGESIRVETITSWIELQADGDAAAADELAPPALLALGGIDYDGEPLPFEELLEVREDTDDALTAGDGALPDTVIRGVSEERGSWEAEFDRLPHSEAEVEAIASSFWDAFGKRAKRDLLLADEASKEAFMKLAPSASVIHLATHGYFAPESVASTQDRRPEHLQQMVAFQDTRQLMTGLAPSLLCGLVFAGANLGPEKVDAILTAEELMHVDLRNAELAVLSACETNVGIERAGLMIGTLRDALHAAGVRRAITSLWRVDDEATRILMTEFYRLHWAEKMPVSEALWAAKMRVRGLKNEDGTPRFGLKHWAAFVVSGVPRRR